MIALIANESDIIRARENLMAAYGSLDAKRPTAWTQYGYPETVTFDMLKRAYERTGAGHGAVHRLLDGCWGQAPRIKSPADDNETPWEKKVSAIFKACRAWSKIKDFDRRQMVGQYAGLIYRVNDGLALDQPLVRASTLVDLIPVYEDQLKVTQWHQDKSQPDLYGKPAMYQYRSKKIGNGDMQGQPEDWADVHPSRVQIWAEGSVGDMFDGVPLLRAGFNSLVDLEKVTGGSAESFLKNSARTIVFKYEPGASVQAITNADGTTTSVRQAHEDQTRALNRNQDSAIVLQGGDASTLQTSVSDPKPSFEVAANVFAASVRLPFTSLFGQQTGRLASDQDKKDEQRRFKGRQENEIEPVITELVTRLQAIGVIESGEFEVEFPDLAAPTDAERLDNVAKMAIINKTNFDAGGTDPVFDGPELRKAADYEERDMAPIPQEGAPAAAE